VSQLAHLLEQHAEEVVRRWVELIREGLAPGGKSEPELRDHIPDFLREVMAALRNGKAPASSAAAQEHGRQRHHVGFSLEALVREYGVLRSLILEFIEETTCPVTLAEVRVLTDFIATAIAEGVSEYVRQREEEKRTVAEAHLQAIRTEAEAERQRLHSLLMQAPVAICIIEGPELTFTLANATYRALVGGRDVVGKPLLEVLPELRGQGFDALLKRVAATGEPFVGHEVLVKLDRTRPGVPEEAFFDFVYTPLRDSAGRIHEVLVVGSDVTEGVLARLRLRESEERLRTVIDAMPNLINFVDVHGRYQLNNLAYQRWFGVPTEALRGKTVRETIGDENFRHIAPYMERALRGEVVAWEAPFVFQDGRRGFIEGTFLPQRDPAGAVTGYVALISDITARKQDETHRKSKADFEQQLIGIVSHDLRNPLNAILLGASALMRREELDERTVKSVLRIQSSAERATRMVKDLLDFTQARLGSGIPIRPGSLDLHVLVRQVVEEVEVTYPGREVQVQHEGEARGEWDSDRIAQLVSNLLTNALKYSPEGSRVDVSTRPEDSWVSLCVHNEGTPIPSEKLPSLFEPLQRATADVDKAGRSVGLGLYIVKHIVDAHGGTITVKSTKAEGTTFTVRLPRKQG
jgi:PAS domain S-box-containing protein